MRYIKSKIRNSVRKIRDKYHRILDYGRENGYGAMIKHMFVKAFRLDEVAYMEWAKGHFASSIELQSQRSTVFEYEPMFSIVVPLYNTPIPFLNAMIESVKNQSYVKWELCLSDGSGLSSPLRKELDSYSGNDQRIKNVNGKKPMNISDNTNLAMQMATGDYIVFLDHDDLLAPDALFECVKAINECREIDVLYSDEDKISMDGKEYFQPHFKTDFNLELLRSMNYICHLFIVKDTIVEQIGGLNPELDGAQDYDFVLRSIEKAKKIYHIPKILYHWRAHNASTAENPESKIYAFQAGARAIEAHYKRVGVRATVLQGPYLGLYHTKHTFDRYPKISIIIPNKDHIDDLIVCLESVRKCHYPDYEIIIVENNSTEQDTFSFYKNVEKTDVNIKIIYWKGEFNYSAINNFGAKHASGEYLLFLNNDTFFIKSDGIEEMLGYCMYKEVGAVGARMYYEDGTIQHAGVIVGFGGVAGHIFNGYPHSANGYFSRILCAQNLSAVTAACMMMKKSVFEKANGFDEDYKVAFNDIDLCMKIQDLQYSIVYNPYAELYHYESKSRGMENTKEKVERFNREVAIFKKKWPEILKEGDPFYNPNLSMEKCDFSLK